MYLAELECLTFTLDWTCETCSFFTKRKSSIQYRQFLVLNSSWSISSYICVTLSGTRTSFWSIPFTKYLTNNWKRSTCRENRRHDKKLGWLGIELSENSCCNVLREPGYIAALTGLKTSQAWRFARWSICGVSCSFSSFTQATRTPESRHKNIQQIRHWASH